jgi:putative endopeptidase
MKDIIESGVVRPQDDFHQWVNGEWFRDNPIPADKAIWGSFTTIAEESTDKIHKIFLELATNTDELSDNEQKVRDFYLSGCNWKDIKKAGVSGIYADLGFIASIRNTKDLVSVIARLHRRGIAVLWDIGVAPDKKDTETYALYLQQSGLGLPDREYYLSDNPHHVAIREKYSEHIQTMFDLAGFSVREDSYIPDIVDIEECLAHASMSRTELRDDEKLYNKRSWQELRLTTPAIDWGAYFSSLGIEGEHDYIIEQPDFFAEVNSLIEGLSLEEWQAYLRWHLLHAAAPYLEDCFVEENFSFYGKVLSGAQEMRPLSKRVTETVNRLLGDAVGKLYVEKHFSSSAKALINEMIDIGIEVFRDRILELDWMDEETKKTALVKLSKLGRKIGYPDTWRDYGGLEIKPDDYLGNVFRANEFEWRRMANRLGEKVDRDEWAMTPQTANAGYHPLMNDVTFPAGIIQPPLFDEKAPVAMNFGGIVAIILHEITHEDDDQGKGFDENGNLRVWWTLWSDEQFMKRANLLLEEWNLETVVFADPNDSTKTETVHVNGKLTLGENIADLGGVSMAFEAMQRYFAKHGRASVGGFTPEQQFFIGQACVWCMHSRDEFAKMMLLKDVHAPAKLRCNATLSHLPEFHEAFDVKEGDKMYRPPERRAKVW